ncbi:hypothetical protein L1987_13169 [Smallanthus sonchifolius]|uniref:Uncharacterized protein n=1 Tax=Smallanthus sonchifolius TaxID=185202 RepID=A0ACB9JHZ0_9ASTR|nr:hypothetical protein L1987_13169 [Smallanthus sonchifolius]
MDVLALVSSDLRRRFAYHLLFIVAIIARYLGQVCIVDCKGVGKAMLITEEKGQNHRVKLWKSNSSNMKVQSSTLKL